MDTIRDKPISNRYSAHNSLRPINLYYNAPDAGSVSVAGSFDNWHPIAMRRQVDGWWHVQVMLCHGHHQYRFLVDDKAILDPMATGVGRDERGEPVSLIAVS